MGLFGNLFSSAPQPQLQAQAQPAAKAKSPRSDEAAVAESIRAINRAGFRQSHPSVDISSTTNTSALVVKAGGVENCATVAALTAVPVEVEEHEDERTVEVAALAEKATKSTTAEYQHNDGGEGVDADEISSKCVELGSGTNRTNSGQPPLKTPVNQSSFAKFELTSNIPQHFVNAPQLAKSPELLPAERDANTEPFKSTSDEQSSGASADRHANAFLLKAVLGGAKKGASGRPAAAHVQGLGSRQHDSEPAGLLTFNNLLGRGFNNLLGGPGSGKRVIVPNQFGLQVSAAMESSSMSQTEQPSGSAGVANGAIPMSIASQLSTGETQGNGNGVEQNMSLVSMSSGVSSLHVPILNIRKPFLAPDVAKADRVEEKKALRPIPILVSLPQASTRKDMQDRQWGFLQKQTGLPEGGLHPVSGPADEDGVRWTQSQNIKAMYEGALLNEIQNSVKKPKNVSEELWLANNFVKIAKEAGMVSTFMMHGCCTESSCPLMRAGNHTYLWQDHNEDGTVVSGMQLAAPKYIRGVLDTAQNMMNDERVFPQKSGVPFPDCLKELLTPQFRRFFRCYCHFYRHHLEQMEQLGVEKRIRFCAAYCTFFCIEFGLVSQTEIDTIQPIVDQWLMETDDWNRKLDEQ